MKKITLLLLAIFITSFALAQDVIVTKDGKKINSKVTEINEYDIRYKNYENLDGPIYTMKKSEIASILYENGQVDVFNLDMQPAYNQQNTFGYTTYYTQTDFNNAKNLRNAGIGCFAGGLALSLTGYILIGTSFNYYYENIGQANAGIILWLTGSAATIAGIVMWPVGQVRMNKIRRLNPNGFSLFENEKMQLNMTLGGNNMGFKLNF